MIAAGRIDPDSVITHRVGLSDAARAYELASSGEAIKVVVLADD
jgi:threonine dehydrogenase-like Zn-dependent dehydrogenase